MFLNHTCPIYDRIRTITSVIPTLGQKNFTKIKFLLEDIAHPSEGWGWGAAQPGRLKVNKLLMLSITLGNLKSQRLGSCK